MSGTNTYEEHLHYNEKGRNKKSIVFDSRQLVEPCQNFLDPRRSRQNFDLRYFFDPCQNLWNHAIHATHVKIRPTPFTPPTLFSRLNNTKWENLALNSFMTEAVTI